MSELYDLSLDELLKGDATLLNKIERDMKVAKAENNVIKFVWISIVIGVVMIILGNVFDGIRSLILFRLHCHGYFLD